jgi:hypothetical protein
VANFNLRKTGADLSLTRTGSGAIASGTPVAKITFTAMVTDTDKTTIRVGSLGFNNNDSLFDVCVLLPQSGTRVDVGLSDFCGKPSLMSYMKNGGQILNKVMIAPDPVTQASSTITVSFEQRQEATIEVSIMDVLGNVVYRQAQTEHSTGSKQYRLAVSSLAAGTYIIRLRTPAQIVSVPVVIAR